MDMANNQGADIRTIVATRLTDIRKQRGLSLSVLAEQSGIAKSTLSNIETGKGNPTIETLWSVANILRVPFSDLIYAADTTDIPSELLRDDGITVQLIERSRQDPIIEAYHMRFSNKSHRIARSHPVGVKETVTVLSGAVWVGPVTIPQLLKSGESTSFDASYDHIYESVGGDASAMVVITYPVSERGYKEECSVKWPENTLEWDQLMTRIAQAETDAQCGIRAQRIHFEQAIAADSPLVSELQRRLVHRSDVSPLCFTRLCHDGQYSVICLARNGQSDWINSGPDDRIPGLEPTLTWNRHAITGQILNPGELDFATATLISEQYVDASLAAEVLIRQGVASVAPTVRAACRNAERKSGIWHYESMRPGYVWPLVWMAQWLIRHRVAANQVQWDSGTSSVALSRWLTQVLSGADKTDDSHQPSVSEGVMIALAWHNDEPPLVRLKRLRQTLQSGERLLINGDMTGPYEDHIERQTQQLVHVLTYLCDTLVPVDEKMQKTLSFNEMTAINRMQNLIPIALYEALHDHLDQAKTVCDELLSSLLELQLDKESDNPAALLCRYQMEELQRMMITLTTAGSVVVSAQRFEELAQSCGFVCDYHVRVYATAGHNKWDAGNHVFVLKAI